MFKNLIRFRLLDFFELTAAAAGALYIYHRLSRRLRDRMRFLRRKPRMFSTPSIGHLFSRIAACITFLCGFIAGVECLGQTTKAPDTSSRRQVEQWLNSVPVAPRDRPPPENMDELENDWIKEGKAIPSAGEVLIEIVRDKSSKRRRLAVSIVGKIAAANALDVLSEVYASPSDYQHLQYDALESLQAIDDPKRLRVLEVALKSTYEEPKVKDESVPTTAAIIRANIAIMLSEGKDKKSQEVLGALVSKEKDAYVLQIIERTINRPPQEKKK